MFAQTSDIGQLLSMTPAIVNAQNFPGLSASLRVNEPHYPTATSHTTQNLHFCGTILDMPCNMISEEVYRNSYIERVTGEKS